MGMTPCLQSYTNTHTHTIAQGHQEGMTQSHEVHMLFHVFIPLFNKANHFSSFFNSSKLQFNKN